MAIRMSEPHQEVNVLYRYLLDEWNLPLEMDALKKQKAIKFLIIIDQELIKCPAGQPRAKSETKSACQ